MDDINRRKFLVGTALTTIAAGLPGAVTAATLGPRTGMPTMNDGSLTYTVHTVPVPPGAADVAVPVELSAAPRQTIVLRALTANDSAREGRDFGRTERYVVFNPGERVKLVRVPIRKSLGAEQRGRLTVDWPQNVPKIKAARKAGYFTGDQSVQTPTLVEDHIPLRSKPDFRTVVLSEDFRAFAVSDSGRGPDGTPCWRARLQHGYEQPDNKELGRYVNPEKNRDVTPWFKDGDGRLVLQSEYQPDGVRGRGGRVLICPWANPSADEPAAPYVYTAPIITSETLPPIIPGDYFEARLTMPQVLGSWPAFWLLPRDGSWPSIEIDVFEGFFNTTTTLARVGTTVHWRNQRGQHDSYGTFLPHLAGMGVDLAEPHTWGCHWGTDVVTFYVDGTPYKAVPNVFPAKPCYLILNIAVGGEVGVPPNPDTDWPVRMPIEFVRVTRPA